MKDWTKDEYGVANSSKAFRALVNEVMRLIETHRIGDGVERLARLIVAQLAHRHGLAPKRQKGKPS